jgi:deoxyribonuclease V
MPVTIHPLHGWDLTPADAIKLQRELAVQVIDTQPLPLDALTLVGGVDVSVKDNVSQAAVVVLTYPDLRLVEAVTASIPTPFPYIPGLLSFREGAVILDAMQKLDATPDVFIFDGAGRAHPRRIGIASHVGLFIDVPTVGCAKSWLIGQHAELPPGKGAWVPLQDKGDTIGVMLRTRDNVKPVYISPGHRATLDTARELVLRTTTRYRLPEPIRAAHNTAGGLDPSGLTRDSDGQLSLF